MSGPAGAIKGQEVEVKLRLPDAAAHARCHLIWLDSTAWHLEMHALRIRQPLCGLGKLWANVA